MISNAGVQITAGFAKDAAYPQETGQEMALNLTAPLILPRQEQPQGGRNGYAAWSCSG
ncbi:hypothetical protein [Leisingera caerulea]|uniref:Uncharacterized protein n=1 Tax=Leisingera caerulea TaxID=506591 RepID=A0A9Q9M287_LEICA|nr:hypothetical protein [Leisingera caerulea]UWQ53289.1 hypothetical protein K3721_15030 [Leisingera caerulea]